MRSKLLHAEPGHRTWALAFEEGDEAASVLLGFARAENLRGASIAGIGGFRHAVLGYFERGPRAYKPIHVREQVEVMSLLGNISVMADGSPRVHVHAVVGKSDGSALGGHLIEGHVWPTLELTVTEFAQSLERTVLDEQTGLPLLKS